jgi:hypothetical protein
MQDSREPLAASRQIDYRLSPPPHPERVSPRRRNPISIRNNGKTKAPFTYPLIAMHQLDLPMELCVTRIGERHPTSASSLAHNARHAIRHPAKPALVQLSGKYSPASWIPRTSSDLPHAGAYGVKRTYSPRRACQCEYKVNISIQSLFVLILNLFLRDTKILYRGGHNPPSIPGISLSSLNMASLVAKNGTALDELKRAVVFRFTKRTAGFIYAIVVAMPALFALIRLAVVLDSHPCPLRPTVPTT